MAQSTIWIRDLDKLNMICWFGFRFEPVFANDNAWPKNVALFKSGLQQNKNNHLAIYIRIESKSLIHMIRIWAHHHKVRMSRNPQLEKGSIATSVLHPRYQRNHTKIQSYENTVHVSLIIRGRYVPSFLTTNTEFVYKKHFWLGKQAFLTNLNEQIRR